MTEALIFLDPDSGLNLQNQIRQKLVDGIVSGTFPPGVRLPSSRKLAGQLGVARNTVVLAYEQLIEEGFLESRERSGIYVRDGVLEGRIDAPDTPAVEAEPDSRWKDRIRGGIERKARFYWPSDWQRYRYPFIDGYFDASLYPTSQWREANRMALGARGLNESSASEGDTDDPVLIEEIRTKMLPRRGVSARPDEILITLGEQNAFYLLTQLLTDDSISVAVEEPGNPRLRSLLALTGSQVIHQPVDENGMVINSRLDEAQLICVTPSHQVPTAVTLATQRRQALLKKARLLDQLLIEDDFEHESNYEGQPHPALRSMDEENRVIYVSALPKVLAPGLRIGFIVAAPDLIRELRRLRQMVIGRPSLVNQRTAALFLSLGHYDSFMMRLKSEMKQRWHELGEALNHYLGRFVVTIPNQGGTVFWVHAPDGVEVEKLTRDAAGKGILIEPDTHYYAGRRRSRNWFRMGVTSIPNDRIREGVRLLRELMWDLAYGEETVLDESDPCLLKNEGLLKTLSGATLIYRTHFGEDCTIELHEDGTMSGRSGELGEDRDSGRWWIEGDVWHRQWNRWSYGETEAYRITVRDSAISWYNLSGRLADRAEIRPARP